LRYTWATTWFYISLNQLHYWCFWLDKIKIWKLQFRHQWSFNFLEFLWASKTLIQMIWFLWRAISLL
jgi:hypothetical protein